MAFSERIKNFAHIRDVMREFYLYGFKSREEYTHKSARSYDDERRRLESWLGEYMGYHRDTDGKNVFLAVDCRAVARNPLYAAWKSASFTDGDITLYFILLDILADPSVKKTVSELIEIMERAYLADFDAPMMPDASTVRKKCREYAEMGILIAEKDGRRVLYRRAESVDITALHDAIAFFSESAPCGVVGSYILDTMPTTASLFAYKHHYITQTMDSDILAVLLDAMQKQCAVRVRDRKAVAEEVVVPLRIFISAQNGRQYLVAYRARGQQFVSMRLDFLDSAEADAPCAAFETLRERLDAMRKHTWGVQLRRRGPLETISFTVHFAADEDYIYRRLCREKRCGTVERIDANHARFTAAVYDAQEMIPWIRTFLCRITEISFSNPALERQFARDFDDLCRLYGVRRRDVR